MTEEKCKNLSIGVNKARQLNGDLLTYLKNGEIDQAVRLRQALDFFMSKLLEASDLYLRDHLMRTTDFICDGFVDGVSRAIGRDEYNYLVDSKGKVLVKAQAIFSSENGGYMVTGDNGSGWFCNSKGEKITQEFDTIHEDFQEGFAVVQDVFEYYLNNKYELCFEEGGYEIARPFVGGIASVQRRGASPWEEIINQKGEAIMKEKFLRVSSYNEDELIGVQFDDSSWGYVDRSGAHKILIDDYKYECVELGSFCEGFAPVCLIENGDKENKYEDKRWYFINKQGVIVFEKKFLAAKGFEQGMAQVKNEDGKWQFIDKEGQVLFDGRSFEVGANFDKDGYIFVRSKSETLLMDRQGVLHTRKELQKPLIEKYSKLSNVSGLIDELKEKFGEV